MLLPFVRLVSAFSRVILMENKSVLQSDVILFLNFVIV